jgi:hypothetical protein
MDFSQRNGFKPYGLQGARCDCVFATERNFEVG